MKLEQVHKNAKTIDGWLGTNEGALLYLLAKQCRKGSIVEIGSWKGRSTVYLASGSQEGNGARVYAVYPHKGSSEHNRNKNQVDTYDEFLKNIKNNGLAAYITPLKMTSQEAVQKVNSLIGLIFIGGAYEYEFVKMDFKIWFPEIVR